MPINKDLLERTIKAASKYDVYGPRVMILRDDSETQTAGGLYIPDKAQKRKNTGTIVKIGSGYHKEATELSCEGMEVGHRVAFNAYDGVEMAIPLSEKSDAMVIVQHAGNIYLRWNHEEA